MKKLSVVFLTVFLAACSETTLITGSWKSSKYLTKSYSKILVAALTSHAVAKSTVENDLALELNKYSVKTYKGIDEFPPAISSADSNKTLLMKKVKGMDIDGILTVSVLRRETESRFVRGTYDPYAVYPYYGSFWGYYSYWYPYAYNPGYYDEKIYYIETNFYDAKTDGLAWSAQSRTYDLLDLPSFSKEFAATIVAKLKEDGIIKGELKKEVTSD